MLGLDAKTLSVPDYEITARLERLLTVVQQPAMAVPVVPVSQPATRPALPPSTTHLTRPMSQPHPAGPSHHHHHLHYPRQATATHSSQGRRRSPSPNTRRSEASQRARSLSPLHVGIDPRTY